MEGSMTWENFLNYVKEILSVSVEIGDNWILKENSGKVGHAYLSKQCLVQVDSHEVNKNYDMECGSEDDDLEDILCDMNEVRREVEQHHLKGEYHVVYSTSYGVPVLYFNLWKLDGTLISIAELWQYVDDSLQKQVKEWCWNMLTQQEHPLLRRPFFQLHPCHTADMLRHPLSANPLVTWLSTVASVVPGLRVSHQYSTLTTHH